MAEFLKPKERMAIPKQIMPEQDPSVRRSNFNEVNYGLTRELAIKEAQRCLTCKTPTCIDGCPVDIKIDDFISADCPGRFSGSC